MKYKILIIAFGILLMSVITASACTTNADCGTCQTCECTQTSASCGGSGCNWGDVRSCNAGCIASGTCSGMGSTTDAVYCAFSSVTPACECTWSCSWCTAGGSCSSPGSQPVTQPRSKVCVTQSNCCGNGVCEHTCSVCPADCSPCCGDGTCDAGEDCISCPSDCTCGSVCGNNVRESGEQCDGSDLGGATCVSRGFSGGTLSCDGSCNYDTSSCTSIVCGNNVRESGEQCDGSDLAGQTCISQGFTGGSLSCDGSCNFDTSACTGLGCGDGTCTVAECGSCAPDCTNKCIDGTRYCQGGNIYDCLNSPPNNCYTDGKCVDWGCTGEAWCAGDTERSPLPAECTTPFLTCGGQMQRQWCSNYVQSECNGGPCYSYNEVYPGTCYTDSACSVLCPSCLPTQYWDESSGLCVDYNGCSNEGVCQDGDKCTDVGGGDLRWVPDEECDCSHECSPPASRQCSAGNTAYQVCGEYDASKGDPVDDCDEWSNDISCGPLTCIGGNCVGGCTPNCACALTTCQGDTCPDTTPCGTDCAGQMTPDCGTRECGPAPNGCGDPVDECGTCLPGDSCDAAGQCICTNDIIFEDNGGTTCTNIYDASTGDHCVLGGDNNLDTECCDESSDCVYLGTCYDAGVSYIDTDGNGVNDAWCKGNLDNHWRDCDTAQGRCDGACGGYWVNGSEQATFGEYENGDGGVGSVGECCEDDAGEFYKERPGFPEDKGCCDDINDVLYKRKCKQYTQENWVIMCNNDYNSQEQQNLTSSCYNMGYTNCNYEPQCHSVNDQSYTSCSDDDYDLACCSDDKSCVYNGICYDDGYTGDIDGDGFLEICIANSEGEWGEMADEICDNLIDDDGDTLIDCADDDCDGRIEGLIFDEYGGRLEGASVTLVKNQVEENIDEYSEPDGSYDVENIRCDSYDYLRAIKDEYQPDSVIGINVPAKSNQSFNFTLVYGIQCDFDCTLIHDNLINKECNGIGGCNFNSTEAANACHLSQPGWTVAFNSTHHIDCAEGAPYIKSNIKAIPRCPYGNLHKFYRIVYFRGQPIRMVTVVCGE